MNAATARIDELVARFGAADACPARLLCDDHPPDQVAFTVVEPDLTRPAVKVPSRLSTTMVQTTGFARMALKG